jgi:hypothetical protein
MRHPLMRPEFFERRAEYDERRAAYTKVAAIIVEGLQKTEEHLEVVADELEENWRFNLYLAVGDFVNSETKILAQRYEQRGGKVGGGAGFVARATAAGAPIIAGVGVVYDIYNGMDHAKAIAKGAAGLVGAGVAASAGILVLRFFGFAAGPGAGVFAGLAGGWVASELAGAGYDLIVPETPREKLFRETLNPDPASPDRPGPQLPEQNIPNGPGAP